jgi:integrative and conjugative element protein (TIGR02256 family)
LRGLSKIKYKIHDNCTLVLTDEVLTQFKKYQQIGDRKEAGGILLGRVFEAQVVIDSITTPSFWDKTGRLYFIRNLKRAQKAVNKAWFTIEGRQIYLGEWHTHPDYFPIPSPDDKDLVSNMLKDTKMEIDFLFLVIIGLGENDIYVSYQKNNNLLRLAKILED